MEEQYYLAFTRKNYRMMREELLTNTTVAFLI